MRRRRARRGKAETIEFCERCGRVCDDRCRADRVREQARTSALAFQVGRR